MIGRSVVCTEAVEKSLPLPLRMRRGCAAYIAVHVRILDAAPAAGM